MVLGFAAPAAGLSVASSSGVVVTRLSHPFSPL
jgi:hypothetical protein